MARQPPLNVEAYRQLARRALPRSVFDYLEGGAGDERGLQHNRDALDAVRLRPRRLRDVAVRDSGVRLFDRTLPAPLAIGPTGFNALFWPEGDLALARAAAAHGIPFVLSTVANTDIETLARATDGEWWFQLYALHDEISEQLMRRARAADCRTLMVTVDVPVNGLRERDLRNGFRLPLRYTLPMAIDGLRHPRWTMRYLRHGMPALANFEALDASGDAVRTALAERRMDAGFSWESLARLRAAWPHRLLVKGILHPDDALRCESLGVDGVILSNHGARQLDGAMSPIEALPAARRATALPLLVDSGFRRGTDIVKAIALGASAVLLGRATLYGLAASGESGVRDVLAMLKREIDCTLAQVGCARISELSPDVLSPDVLAPSPASGGPPANAAPTGLPTVAMRTHHADAVASNASPSPAPAESAGTTQTTLTTTTT